MTGVTREEPKPPAPPEVLWSTETLLMLDERDRYTRSEALYDFNNAIRKEFNGKAGKNFIKFDDLLEGYVTPVAGTRYMLVWYYSLQRNEATVVGLAPYGGNLETATLPERHDYVQRVLKRESKGKINLP